MTEVHLIPAQEGRGIMQDFAYDEDIGLDSAHPRSELAPEPMVYIVSHVKSPTVYVSVRVQCSAAEIR